MEINEELRHNDAPFKIIIWPGAHDELYAYADEEKIDDPNTIFLVPEAYLPDDAYPLGSWSEKRTRALSAGFIFSKIEPHISIDPSELQECRWQTTSSVFRESESLVARDLPVATTAIIEQIFQDSPLSRFGTQIIKNLIKRTQGGDFAEKP